MPANTDPIWSKIGNVQGTEIGGTANTRSDGNGTIGTDIYKCFTADATNGSWVSRIRFSLVISGALTASAATVHRVYVSNKTSGATTQADTWLFQEVAAPSQTPTSTSGMNFIEIPLMFALDPSYTILVSSHVVNTANTDWTAIVFGGKY
jgi:hypothetical protein